MPFAKQSLCSIKPQPDWALSRGRGEKARSPWRPNQAANSEPSHISSDPWTAVGMDPNKVLKRRRMLACCFCLNYTTYRERSLEEEEERGARKSLPPGVCPPHSTYPLFPENVRLTRPPREFLLQVPPSPHFLHVFAQREINGLPYVRPFSSPQPSPAQPKIRILLLRPAFCGGKM